MSFTSLRLDECAHCDCLNGAVEDTERMFIRRTSDSKKLRNGDFKVKLHSPDKSLPNNATCKDYCDFRELSIDCLDGYDENAIAEAYREAIKPVLKISPERKYYYAKVRFKADAGVVKHTPLDGQQSHHDFYKSDGFTLDSIIPQGVPTAL